MYYGNNDFSIKYLVNNITLFTVGDSVIVRTTRDGGRSVGTWGILTEKTPTVGNQGYLKVRHKDANNHPGPGDPNDWITQGDIIAKAPLSLNINSPISGPFINTTVNGISTNYYQPIDNFNPDRHQIFNYNPLNQTIPTSKNSSVLINTDFAAFNYSGLCFFERILDKPRQYGGWNSLGNRLQVMLTRQHIMVCGHYPVTLSKNFFVTDGTNFYSRKTRRTISPSEYSIPPNSSNQPVIGSGYMVPAQYPIWYALQNPGKDILDEYPDLTLADFSVFADFLIQTIKNPVPENATAIFALNKKRFKLVPELTNKPYLLIQSSFHFAGINIYGSEYSTIYGIDSLSAGTSSSFYVENISTIPQNILTTDFLNGFYSGDSGSALVFKYTKPDETTVYLSGGLVFNRTGDDRVNFNSDGTYQSCSLINVSDPPCSPLLTYTSEGLTSGFSVFDEKSYKVLEIILKDKSWQITASNRIIPNEPELNIEESDLIDTLPRIVEVNSNLDDKVPISQFQYMSLSSGINYFSTKQKVFSGIAKEDIFNEDGTDFVNLGNFITPSLKESLLDFQYLDPDNIYPNADYSSSLPRKFLLANTSNEILDITTNPNQTRKVFQYGGDLTAKTNLDSINKSFNTSGMVVYKTKK
jgi:hypothetical protein